MALCVELDHELMNSLLGDAQSLGDLAAPHRPIQQCEQAPSRATRHSRSYPQQAGGCRDPIERTRVCRAGDGAFPKPCVGFNLAHATFDGVQEGDMRTGAFTSSHGPVAAAAAIVSAGITYGAMTF